MSLTLANTTIQVLTGLLAVSASAPDVLQFLSGCAGLLHEKV